MAIVNIFFLTKESRSRVTHGIVACHYLRVSVGTALYTSQLVLVVALTRLIFVAVQVSGL